jgi:hypothetical protein
MLDSQLTWMTWWHAGSASSSIAFLLCTISPIALGAASAQIKRIHGYFQALGISFYSSCNPFVLLDKIFGLLYGQDHLDGHQ